MTDELPELHWIVVQLNPRSPVHYRGKGRVFAGPQMGEFAFRGEGKITKHYWSWSPLFWWKILMAWIRPEKEEIDENS